MGAVEEALKSGTEGVEAEKINMYDSKEDGEKGAAPKAATVISLAQKTTSTHIPPTTMDITSRTRRTRILDRPKEKAARCHL